MHLVYNKKEQANGVRQSQNKARTTAAIGFAERLFSFRGSNPSPFLHNARLKFVEHTVDSSCGNSLALLLGHSWYQRYKVGLVPPRSHIFRPA